MISRLRRRSVLRIGACVATGASSSLLGSALAMGRAWAAPAPFEVRELRRKGRHASAANLLLPTNVPLGAPRRLLVALHGLGESFEEALGVRAWLDLYGLRSAYPRLLSPPLEPLSRRGDWPAGRLEELNRALAAQPFGGLAVLCPFTPNFRDVADRASAIASYGDWLTKELVPAALELLGDAEDASVTLDGCSMGGPIAIDVYCAHPDRFRALGLVQAAFGVHRAPIFAKRIAEARGQRPLRVHLLTSTGDGFRDAHVALAGELRKASVDVTLRIPNGPHDQPFLRETGTIEMLLFHERGAG